MSDKKTTPDVDSDTKLNRRQILAGASTIGAAVIGTASVTIAANTPPIKLLAGKSILITGTSSGFGYLGALHYAREGARVIATMRGLPRPEASALAQIAADEKLDLHIIEIDILSDESVAKGAAAAEKIAGGAIDVLINNAGIGLSGPVELQDMEATKLIFDTNVFGVQRMTRAILPAMRQQKSGQIFNISSQLGRIILPGSGHYSPTKFALEALSEEMAYELVPHNIDVTIIQPGGYPTDIWKKRNAYTLALKERSDQERIDAYPAITARMGTEDGGGRDADPMDIPHAIAEIIAMPVGKRPLRKAVHPNFRPSEAINKIAADTQIQWLGATPYGPWIKAVHN